MPLNPDVVRLAEGPNLATVVTLMPDGQPQALLTWIDSDGEHLLVNTEPQRQRVDVHEQVPEDGNRAHGRSPVQALDGL